MMIDLYNSSTPTADEEAPGRAAPPFPLFSVSNFGSALSPFTLRFSLGYLIVLPSSPLIRCFSSYLSFSEIMASQSAPHSLSAQYSSVVSVSPSSSIPQGTSSQATATSAISASVTRISASPSKISGPLSVPSTTASSSSPSIDTIPSPSISPSSSGQTPSHASTDAQVTSGSHRPAIIAATIVSIGTLLLLIPLLFCIYRQRRARQNQPTSSQRHCFLPKNTVEDDEKSWKDSPRSAAGSGWPEESWVDPAPPSVERVRPRQSVTSFSTTRAPHYTVRSHASMGDIYGFGQDVAWQEAHYEDPLPIGGPPASFNPEIDVIPPTPGIIHHDMPVTPLLRNPSTGSHASARSEYSTASMDVAA
ncbi:hypothetical protein DFH07DRAFT_1063610 [Mycena maculata]|uniref:Uncharacterized protein n=1 Tax=Mycena maculata TaxID=230809 RepID=A0AAD7IH67_9AGAR|nr:hypothetical protein DFH07DRAFT_1063610 [Mycena maculata]